MNANHTPCRHHPDAEQQQRLEAAATPWWHHPDAASSADDASSEPMFLVDASMAVNEDELGLLSDALARLSRCNTLGDVMALYRVTQVSQNGSRLHGFGDYYAVHIHGGMYGLKACKDCGHLVHYLADHCHICGCRG